MGVLLDVEHELLFGISELSQRSRVVMYLGDDIGNDRVESRIIAFKVVVSGGLSAILFPRFRLFHPFHLALHLFATLQSFLCIDVGDSIFEIYTLIYLLFPC
jgi:hypothetical protein